MPLVVPVIVTGHDRVVVPPQSLETIVPLSDGFAAPEKEIPPPSANTAVTEEVIEKLFAPVGGVPLRRNKNRVPDPVLMVWLPTFVIKAPPYVAVTVGEFASVANQRYTAFPEVLVKLHVHGDGRLAVVCAVALGIWLSTANANYALHPVTESLKIP